MKWVEKLKDSIITFLSSLIVICFLPMVQQVAQYITIFLSIDEKNLTRVEATTVSFFVGVTYFILRIIFAFLGMMFEFLCDRVQVDVESKFIKLKFMLRLPLIPLRIIKFLGGTLRISFNPNLINCELDDGFLDGNEEGVHCYREGKHIHINLFPVYGPSEDPVSNSLDFNIQPLQQSTAKVAIDIVPERNDGWLGIILYPLRWIFLKFMVRIEQPKIILKS